MSTIEEVKDYSKMTILKRLADIQMELLKVEVEQKNGFHGEYMPLEQLNSIILPKCFNRGLTYYFTCSDTHLILELFDIKTGDRLSPAPHIRLPELTKDMKAEGGNNTYFKRYLLMNTFLVCAESFDPDDTCDGLPPEKNNASSAKNTKKESSAKKKSESKKESETVREDLNLQDLLDKALTTLQKKGLTHEEITAFAVKKCIQRMDKFNKKELKVIYDFVNEYFEDGASK